MARPQRWDQCLCQDMPCYQVGFWPTYASTSDRRWQYDILTRNSSTETVDRVCETFYNKKIDHALRNSIGFNDLFNTIPTPYSIPHGENGEYLFSSTWNPLRGVWEGSATTSIQEPDYPYQINMETFPRHQHTGQTKEFCQHLWISSSTGDLTPKLALDNWTFINLTGGGIVSRHVPSVESTSCGLSGDWADYWDYLPKCMKTLPKGLNVIVSSSDPFITRATSTSSLQATFGTFFLANDPTFVATTGSTVHPNCSNGLTYYCPRNWNHFSYFYGPTVCAGPNGSTFAPGTLSGITGYFSYVLPNVGFNFGSMQSHSKVRLARNYYWTSCTTNMSSTAFLGGWKPFRYFQDNNVLCASSTGWLNFSGSTAWFSDWSYPSKIRVEFGGWY